MVKCRKLLMIRIHTELLHLYYLLHSGNLTIEEKLMQFNGIFGTNPMVHVGPYLAGICYGFCRYSSGKKIKMNSLLLIIGKVLNQDSRELCLITNLFYL